jgi:hypothetical protein
MPQNLALTVGGEGGMSFGGLTPLLMQFLQRTAGTSPPTRSFNPPDADRADDDRRASAASAQVTTRGADEYSEIRERRGVLAILPHAGRAGCDYGFGAGLSRPHRVTRSSNAIARVTNAQ